MLTSNPRCPFVRPGLLATGLLGAVFLAGSCAKAHAPNSLRLDSAIGQKAHSLSEAMDQRPLLSDLNVDELDSPWASQYGNYDPPASPALDIGSDDESPFEFRGMPLGEVIAFLGAAADVNIMFDPSLSQPVDASFPSVRVGEALYMVLEQNSLELVEDPPGVYSVRNLDAGGGHMRSFQLSSIRAADAAAAATLIAGNEATIVMNEAQNLLFVRGSKDSVAAVAAYLSKADQLERQVLIEVRILEAIIDESFELGISHAFNGSLNGNAFTIAQNLGTGSVAGFDAMFSFDGGDITSTINALQSYVDLELISAPRVMAVSGSEARISVIEEIPYIEATASTATDAGQATTAIEQIAFKEAGVRLQVTPTIQGNGILKVLISQELSEVVGQFQSIPIIDKRTLESEFLVADRQTIVLGGLMQDRRSDAEDGIPVLKDLPLLGRFFSNDTDVTEKRELLVFVTPRVVDPNEAAVLAKRYQRDFERKRGASGMDIGSR